MKLIPLFLVLIMAGRNIYAQEADSSWIVSNYTKQEQYIPMRDGKKLFTSIYLPRENRGHHPILLWRTPYSCEPYGDSAFRKFWESPYQAYLREGYIMVIQDVRGRYMSEGEYMDVRPFIFDKKAGDIDEASDTYDTVEWLLAHLPGNNGKVGVYGISYPGFYAAQAAVSHHPAIVAVSPQAPVTEWFLGDDFHHNGAFMQLDAFGFYVLSAFGNPRPHPTPKKAVAGFKPFTSDMYEFFLGMGSIPALTKATGDSIAFWKELMRHPNYDEFWKARNARNAMKNVKPAVLVVGGLFDAEDCYGAWNLYQAIERQSPATDNRLVMGPWSHGQWATFDGNSLGNIRFGSNTSTWYFEHIELPFFNYHLKGKGDLSGLPEATIFFSGENNWKQYQTWPPKNMREKPLYFSSRGKLEWQPPSAASGYSVYTSDPAKPVPYTEAIHNHRTAEYMIDDQRFAARRPDVLVFQTDVLKEDITLGGPLTADLRVSMSGTDADFIVKLVDVFPDDFEYDQPGNAVMNSYQMLVRGEVMRGKYRNSFEKPEPFVPGKTTTVRFSIPDIAHTFKKGHRIMVQVQSSWFPLVSRNPQTFVDIYHAPAGAYKKADIRLYHDRSQPSSITLPVIE